MARSNYKISVFPSNHLKKIIFNKEFNNKDMLISRNLLIHPFIVGKKIYIHSGRKIFSVTVTKNMIGHKVGEFRKTRFLTKHTSKSPKWKKKKKV